MNMKILETPYGICHLSVVPVRLEPFEGAEMITQLLFGELLQVIDKEEHWSYVRLLFDNIEGWVANSQFTEISDKKERKIRSPMAYKTPFENRRQPLSAHTQRCYLFSQSSITNFTIYPKNTSSRYYFHCFGIFKRAFLNRRQNSLWDRCRRTGANGFQTQRHTPASYG